MFFREVVERGELRPITLQAGGGRFLTSAAQPGAQRIAAPLFQGEDVSSTYYVAATMFGDSSSLVIQ
jgi:hypothetical protein